MAVSKVMAHGKIMDDEVYRQFISKCLEIVKQYQLKRKNLKSLTLTNSRLADIVGYVGDVNKPQNDADRGKDKRQAGARLRTKAPEINDRVNRKQALGRLRGIARGLLFAAPCPEMLAVCDEMCRTGKVELFTGQIIFECLISGRNLITESRSIELIDFLILSRDEVAIAEYARDGMLTYRCLNRLISDERFFKKFAVTCHKKLGFLPVTCGITAESLTKPPIANESYKGGIVNSQNVVEKYICEPHHFATLAYSIYRHYETFMSDEPNHLEVEWQAIRLKATRLDPALVFFGKNLHKIISQNEIKRLGEALCNLEPRNFPCDPIAFTIDHGTKGKFSSVTIDSLR